MGKGKTKFFNKSSARTNSKKFKPKQSGYSDKNIFNRKRPKVDGDENIIKGDKNIKRLKGYAETSGATNNNQHKQVLQEEFEDEPKDAFSLLVENLNGQFAESYSPHSSDSDDEELTDKLSKAEQEQGDKDSASSVGDENELPDDEDEFDQAVQDVSPEDPFEVHFQRDLSDSLYVAISSQPPSLEGENFSWPVLGNVILKRPNMKEKDDAGSSNSKIKLINISLEKEMPVAEPAPLPSLQKEVNWDNFYIKTQIQNNIQSANAHHLGMPVNLEKPLTPLQNELMTLMKNYQDVYYPERSLDNGEEIRFVYCLHAINHALKTRLKVIHHNSRLTDKSNVPEEFRDQGLVRPKVLILVPFRESALRVVKIIMSILLPDEKANVVNKKRFMDEFTGGEIIMPHKNPKPVDYEQTFKGNVDDNFKIGISVTKKSLKLYADFYSSDIIVASSLGLRVTIGAEGEAERDYDFLASVELLILDQAEMFLMQNWDHLLHIFDHLHLQPRSAHGTDFSRIRAWALNGWTQYYRQTLLFASNPLPLITALYQKKCRNYAGQFTIFNPSDNGSICQVAVKIPQVFCRIECSSAVTSADKRFQYFLNEILPQMKDPFMKHSLIYVPSYLDYVLIRNHFKKETVSFVQICEYSKDGKIARARDKFFHGESHFLLYSERFHFYRRIRLKGIRHILFYQPPTFPHLYSEICNLIQDDGDTNMSVSTLYSKYDLPQLTGILGTSRASRFIKSSKLVHRLESK